jgi:hypothetical protein
MQAGRSARRCTSVPAAAQFRPEVTVQESCMLDGALGAHTVPPASLSFKQRQITPTAAH